MERKEIINETVAFVMTQLAQAEGGHDWFHVERVWQMASEIAREEKVDMLVVELAALLHDIADSKFHQGNEEVGPQTARKFLESLDVAEETIAHVVKIVENVSFKGGNHPQDFNSPELEVVQDADRLDALGAIGIARTFNYGGHKGRALYDPEIKPRLDMTKEEYKKSDAPTINHFYEKLLLLKDRMNTETGKRLALQRHRFMEAFLRQFYAEWEGKR